MGAVYQALELSLDRRVALKVISPRLSSNELYRRLFQQEARHAASIEHPNVLPVYQAGEGPGGELFLSMRLIRGHDLGRRLARGESLSPREAVSLLVQVASALDAAHLSGLVHRDVKPGNVLLEPREDGTHVYLSDFGLAQRVEPAAAPAGDKKVRGTVDYMPPEQIQGLPVDETADVYAFGCLLYRCLVGEVPFPRASPPETMVAHLNAPIPRPSDAVPGLPDVLDVLVLRALEKDPARRARSVLSLMRHAEAQLGSERPRSAAERHTPAPARAEDIPLPQASRATSRRPRRGARLIAALLLGGLALAGLSGLAAIDRESGATPDPRAAATEALDLTAEGVRMSTTLAAAMGELGTGASPATRREVGRELSVLPTRAATVSRRARRLPASPPTGATLRRAARRGAATARALAQIAADPSAPISDGAAAATRREYGRLLGDLRTAVRAVEQALARTKRLKASDARTIASIDRGIARARREAGPSLDNLAHLVE